MPSGRMRRIRHVFFYCSDLILILLSSLIAYFILSLVSTAPPVASLYFSTFIFLLFSPISHLSVGLYDRKTRDNVRWLFRRAVISVALLFMFNEVVTALVSPYETARDFNILTLGLMLFFHVSFRFITLFKGKTRLTKQRVLIIGAGNRAEFIAKRMRRKVDRKHLTFLGFSPSARLNNLLKENEKILNKVNELDFIDEYNENTVDTIVLANESGDKLPIEDLLRLRMKGVDIINFNDFIESELHLIEVDTIKPKWLLVSNGFKFNNIGYDFFNVLINMFLSVLVLSVTWPIMLCTILAIYLDDGYKNGAPIFYRQSRVGKNGELFNILKFRSMGVDSEKNGAQWAQKNDLRVTRIGGFLRKYRIDELPQILNVLRGEMVFIGPRPERPEFVAEFKENIPFFTYRHSVKPGLTGWAQLNYPYGASKRDSVEKLKFDLYYIKHRSVLLDLLIMIRTVEIVLLGKGR